MFATHRLLVSRLLGVLVLAYVFAARPPEISSGWLGGFGEIAGLFLLSTAALGRLWCLVYVTGKKDRILLTDGPYSIVRNPLYVFSFLGAIGFGLAVENPWLAASLAAWFVFYYSLTVAREEVLLAAIFGAPYAHYCASTPRWIPDLRNFHEPETVEVFAGKMRHGILDAMWFLWVFILWEILEELRVLGVLHTWI